MELREPHLRAQIPKNPRKVKNKMLVSVPTGVQTPKFGKFYQYIDSIQLSASSAWAKLFEWILGEKGKNISLVDGIAVTASTAGMLLTPYDPTKGALLFLAGSIPLTSRRGPTAAFAAPLAVVAAVKNPTLAAAAAKETFSTLNEGAKEALKLGFQVSGVLVTAAGAVVGVILTRKTHTQK